MDKICGVFQHIVVQQCKAGFLIILQNVVELLLLLLYLKACGLTLKSATISRFAALAAGANHRRDIEQMETKRVGCGSDS